MTKKLLVVFTLVVALTSSCNLFGRGPIPVAVSAGVGGGPSASISVHSRSVAVESMSDEIYFKEDRKTANRGTLLYTLTPESFVLDMDVLVLYNETLLRGFSTAPLLGYTTNPDGGIIPKHIDLAYADDFIRDVEVTRNTFDGLSMQFLPSGNGESNDGYYVRSVSGISLPPVYDGIALAGDVTDQIDGLPAGLRYFGFESLQPIETNNGFLSYLTIGSNVAEDGIQNPTGAMGTWINPVTETSGNSVSLYFAAESSIDFRSFTNPEIVFDWNLDGLVQVWDAGSPLVYADDIVTFRLNDPFPVSIVVQENVSTAGSDPNDSTPPAEVVAPAISGPTTYNTLQWINPRDTDFKEVVVTRRAGSAPASRNDGEEVYRGHQPNHVDSGGASGTHYFYLVQTVDTSGNYSSGVVLDQVQP